LLLELGANNETFTRVIGTWPLSPSFHSFQVNRQATEMRLLEGFLSMQLHWAGLNVEDTTLNSPAEVATFIEIYTWQLIKLRKIMSQFFFALLHVLGINNKLIDIIVLRRHHAAAQVGSTAATVSTVLQIPSIYPRRTLEEMN